MAMEGFGQIAEQLRRSTVQVRSGGRGQGWGIITSSDGVIVTNAHVVRDSPLFVHFWDGSTFPATLQGRNPRRDPAVLKVATLNLPPGVEALLRAPSVASMGSGEGLVENLTPRETEVLRLLAAGLGNKEIASRLGISDHTVKFHVASIMGKLGAASRTEAVTLGIRHGMVMV